MASHLATAVPALPAADLAGEVREIVDDGGCGSGADDRLELLARGAAYAGKAAEGRQQRAAPARTDAPHGVQLGPQVPHAAGFAVERHGETVGFVANPLH